MRPSRAEIASIFFRRNFCSLDFSFVYCPLWGTRDAVNFRWVQSFVRSRVFIQMKIRSISNFTINLSCSFTTVNRSCSSDSGETRTALLRFRSRSHDHSSIGSSFPFLSRRCEKHAHRINHFTLHGSLVLARHSQIRGARDYRTRLVKLRIERDALYYT